MFSKKLTITFLSSIIGAILLPLSATQGQYQRTPQAQSVEEQQTKISLVTIAPRFEYGRFGFSDIAILNGDEIWAVGYDGQDPQRMWYSGNGGNSWEVKPAPTGGFTLHNIFFADQQNGWAFGGQKIFIRTSDGGKTWTQGQLPTWLSGSQVRFATSSIGYVAGGTGTCDRGNCTSGIKILRTTDGGRHWHVCYKDNSSYNIHGIAAPTEKVAIIAVDGNFLLRTENGGKTWRVAGSPKLGASNVRFDLNGIGWVVGRHGSFYFSADQGRTWQRPAGFPQSLSNRYWWDIDFADQRVGIAVADEGAIALTSDGGATWAEYPLRLNS